VIASLVPGVVDQVEWLALALAALTVLLLIGAGIGGLFSYGFYRKAVNLVAAGKPVGFGLGKLAPAIGGVIGGWSLYKQVTKEWNAEGNTRKWDDVIRIASNVMQVAGAVFAFVPALGIVPALGLQLASVGVTWVGEMFNDMPAKIAAKAAAEANAAAQAQGK